MIVRKLKTFDDGMSELKFIYYQNQLLLIFNDAKSCRQFYEVKENFLCRSHSMKFLHFIVTLWVDDFNKRAYHHHMWSHLVIIKSFFNKQCKLTIADERFAHQVMNAVLREIKATITSAS